MSQLTRKAHYGQEKDGDVAQDSLCLTARIAQEFGDTEVPPSGPLQEERGHFAPCGRKLLLYHYIAFCEFPSDSKVDIIDEYNRYNK